MRPWTEANSRIVVVATACLLAATPSFAHKPDFGDGAYDGPASAYQVSDPEVSIVIYRDVTCERPELWLELRAEAGFPLFVQLLVPAIDRLTSYRPSLAVVGPGIQRRSIGIDLPAGMGATVFETDNVTPELFNEVFTGTQDWILVEETLVLPRSGTYYVVAWDPAGYTGKLAVAVGTVEDFGGGDLLQFPEWRREARSFHELGRFAPREQVAETRCPH